MNSSDPHALPYEDAINDLAEQLEDARAKVAEIERKLQWWEEGRQLYEGGPTAITDREGDKPTLGAAILRIVGQRSLHEWETAEIVQELERHGWMPNGATAVHAVRGKLSDLAGEGKLVRLRRGVYQGYVEEA